MPPLIQGLAELFVSSYHIDDDHAVDGAVVRIASGTVYDTVRYGVVR